MSITRRENIPEELKKYSPIFLVTNILSHKWTLCILLSLTTPKRFNQLKRAIGISHSMLSRELKDMEWLQLIHRRVVPGTNPPEVEYSLHGYGVKLLEECLAMLSWATEYDQQIITRNEHKSVEVNEEGYIQ